MFILFFIPILFSINTYAAESEVLLPPVEFRGNATFETLDQDTFVPSQTTPLSGDRSTTLDTFKWNDPYPVKDLGFPGGASAISVGGRSIEDTQVTTLGVPFNLPQGGGADFSFFPSYLWDGVTLTPTTSGGGFAPSAASGHVEFIPWTRARLLDQKNLSDASRIGATYDRDLQTYSLGTKREKYSILAGGTTGRMNGIAGEASTIVFQNPSARILAHVIGTNEKADSPGSIFSPSPRASLKGWRILPVLESSFKLSDDFQYSATAFADLNNLVFENPDAVSRNSDTRTQQFGLENTLQNGVNTLAFSARFVRFTGASFGEQKEWPFYAGFTREFFLSDSNSLKTTVSGIYEDRVGVYPGARASFKFGADEKTYYFLEGNTIAKMPTLVDRYSVYGTFHGNPNLKPERVFAALGGYTTDHKAFKSTTTLKAEYRQQIQVTDALFTTVVNAGNAYLYSLNEEFSAPLIYWLDFRGSTLFTYSKLQDSNFAYPDLPLMTVTAGLFARYHDRFGVGTNGRFVGRSDAFGGGNHPGYVLMDAEAEYHFTEGVVLKAGVDNLLNTDAQAVIGYPLEARRFFTSLTANF